jgi:diacylglycerol O-acyltransferase
MIPARRGRPRPALAGEVVVVAFLLVGYDRIAAFAGGRTAAAVAHARELLAVERPLHLAVEARMDRALAPHAGLGRVLSVYYDVAHATVTMTVLGLLYGFGPAGYRHARRALVAINVMALGLFAVLPVAPPRLLPGSGFHDVVAFSGSWGTWELPTSSFGRHADLYAAFPSLHAAWAVWVLLAVYGTTRRRLLRGLAVTHLALTVLIVLSTGNHYLLDVGAGAALAVGCWCPGTRWAAWPRWTPEPAGTRPAEEMAPTAPR